MQKKQYTIDILSFIKSLTLKTFTVRDVTRHLLENHETMFDKKKNATQFVYRHLKLLEKQGVIKTLITNKQKAIVFGWSEQYDEFQKETKNLPVKNKKHHVIIKKLQEKIRLIKRQLRWPV